MRGRFKAQDLRVFQGVKFRIQGLGVEGLGAASPLKAL